MHYKSIFSIVLAGFWMVLQAAAEGKINTLSLVEDPAVSETSTSQEGDGEEQKASRSVVLTIDTVPGNEYQIRATASLVSGIWHNIGSVFTATQSVTKVSFLESDAYRYFRAIVVAQTFAPLPPPLSAPPPPPPPPPA